MAHGTSATRTRVLGRPGAPQGHLTVLAGGRGVPEQVTQRRTDALAPVMEGIALANDAIACAERVYVALRADNPHAALHEVGRLSVRAVRSREEFRSMAASIEPRPKGVR